MFLVSCSSRPLSEHPAHEARTLLERWPSTWSLPVAQQAVQFHTWSPSAGTWKHPTKKLKQHPRRQQSPTNKLPAPWCHTSRLPQACLSLHERDGTLEIMKGHQNCLLQTTAAQYSKKPFVQSFSKQKVPEKVTLGHIFLHLSCHYLHMLTNALHGAVSWSSNMTENHACAAPCHIAQLHAAGNGNIPNVKTVAGRVPSILQSILIKNGAKRSIRWLVALPWPSQMRLH